MENEHPAPVDIAGAATFSLLLRHLQVTILKKCNSIRRALTTKWKEKVAAFSLFFALFLLSSNRNSIVGILGIASLFIVIFGQDIFKTWWKNVNYQSLDEEE
ncbi:hypothetical protein [Aliiroseovarius crassostreae]|uniref:hypothetical protein n=1 Tax=Aliiroseovarius crassostreae TaxID=154981 RepID=UPI0021FB65CF|nr:hypothetical protein [Aliiroseovarius crassostreae]UWP90180.1 hypothetical protein K3J57_05795 [Aliiroseovarius crassostreae]